MKAILLQTSDPVEYAPFLAATSRTTSEFCRRQGIEYRQFTGIKRGSFPWHSTYNRITMMQELLEEGHRGWVIYLDADAYVVDLDFPISDYLIGNIEFAMIAARINSTAPYWNINAGVLFINLTHAIGRQLVAELVEKLTAVTEKRQFKKNEWPYSELRLDDQGLLQTILMENPEWEEFIKYEPQTLINSLDASFVRHHLRAMTPDLADRLRLVEAAVDQIMQRSDEAN
jgi:hypothetical protein